MPSRPYPNHLTAAQPSDCESDVPTYIHSDTLPPPSAQRTNSELNLSVLRRHLPSIISIVSIAPYAVVYDFVSTSEGVQWEKLGVEGTLFICQQSPDPTTASERYSALVLNRKGLNDFKCPLEGEIEFEDGYIILRSIDEGNGEKIYGLWIFEEHEGSSTAGVRELNARIIQDCAARVGRTPHRGRKDSLDMLDMDGIANDFQQPAPDLDTRQQEGFIRSDLRSGTRTRDNNWTPHAVFGSSQALSDAETQKTDVLDNLFRRAEQQYRGR
ncbi:MAG: hypothetical protein LQ342_000584 [Letrouitia transgressa]|nr:MAG: hypothetical protein LQ342_000584 [Letrouitia transgressa]